MSFEKLSLYLPFSQPTTLGVSLDSMTLHPADLMTPEGYKGQCVEKITSLH